VSALDGAVSDSGTDTGLSLLNTLGGIKVSSYDYEMSKRMMMVDAIESGYGIKGGKTFYGELMKGAGRVLGVGKHNVTSFYNKTKQYPAKYKIAEDDLIDFEKRKAIANKKIEAKYGAFKGDSKLQWSLMEGRQNFETAIVKQVIDGDTFVATNEKGEDISVRVLLIDTPETVDKRKDYKMPVGKEASDNAKKTLGKKQVMLFKDDFGDEEDGYGRSLFYVHTTDGDYAKEAIRKGFGRTFFEQNQERVDEYRNAQSQASEEKKGIWGFKGYPNVDEDYFNSDVRSVKEWQERNK
jgi:micrococcal nuclease